MAMDIKDPTQVVSPQLGSDDPMAEAEEPTAEGGISLVPPCRLIVRVTAGARVIGKQGASIKAKGGGGATSCAWGGQS